MWPPMRSYVLCIKHGCTNAVFQIFHARFVSNSIEVAAERLFPVAQHPVRIIKKFVNVRVVFKGQNGGDINWVPSEPNICVNVIKLKKKEYLFLKK